MITSIKITISAGVRSRGGYIAANLNGSWKTVMKVDNLSHDFTVTPVGGARIHTYDDDAPLPEQLEVIHGSEHWLCRRLIGHKNVYLRVGVVMHPTLCVVSLNQGGTEK